MKHVLNGILFSVLIVFHAVGQPGAGGGQAVAALTAQVNKMGHAFINGDYRTFGSYIYPKIVAMIGGPDKLAAQMDQVIAQMKGQGLRFSKISFDAPSGIVTSGHELQCMVPQHTEMLQGSDRIVTTSTLIAISADGGKDWTFVDTSNKDMATIRRLLPNLNAGIVIPPQQPPVRNPGR